MFGLSTPSLQSSCIVKTFALNFSLFKSFQIRITGIRGQESSGYVALDDFELLTLEKCLIRPPDADPSRCPEGKFKCNSGQCVDEVHFISSFSNLLSITAIIAVQCFVHIRQIL